jgi:uncharacterized protein (TIGR00290 family)
MAHFKILISWSSGKDSAWMLHRLRAAGEIEIAGLFTTTTEAADEERVAMHRVRRSILRAQAVAAGLPLDEILLPDPCSEEAYAAAMRAFVDRTLARGVTHIAFGDLFLEEVRGYREQRLEGTGLQPIFPLWGSDTAALAEEMLSGGLQARVASVDLGKLGAAFLGRAFDRNLLDDLPEGSDPCGEYGEFHTVVTAGPMFARSLSLDVGARTLGDAHGHIDFHLRDGAAV